MLLQHISEFAASGQLHAAVDHLHAASFVSAETLVNWKPDENTRRTLKTIGFVLTAFYVLWAIANSLNPNKKGKSLRMGSLVALMFAVLFCLVPDQFINFVNWATNLISQFATKFLEATTGAGG